MEFDTWWFFSGRVQMSARPAKARGHRRPPFEIRLLTFEFSRLPRRIPELGGLDRNYQAST